MVLHQLLLSILLADIRLQYQYIANAHRLEQLSAASRVEGEDHHAPIGYERQAGGHGSPGMVPTAALDAGERAHLYGENPPHDASAAEQRGDGMYKSVFFLKAFQLPQALRHLTPWRTSIVGPPSAFGQFSPLIAASRVHIPTAEAMGSL